MIRFMRCLVLLSISWRLGAPAATGRSSLVFGFCGAALAWALGESIPLALWGLAFSAAALLALPAQKRTPLLPALASLLCQYSVSLFHVIRYRTGRAIQSHFQIRKPVRLF